MILIQLKVYNFSKSIRDRYSLFRKAGKLPSLIYLKVFTGERVIKKTVNYHKIVNKYFFHHSCFYFNPVIPHEKTTRAHHLFLKNIFMLPDQIHNEHKIIKRQVAATKWSCPDLVEGSCRSGEQTEKTFSLCISRCKKQKLTAPKLCISRCKKQKLKNKLQENSRNFNNFFKDRVVSEQKLRYLSFQTLRPVIPGEVKNLHNWHRINSMRNFRISSEQAPVEIHIPNEMKDNDILHGTRRQGIKSKKKYGIAASYGELNPLCGIKNFHKLSLLKSSNLQSDNFTERQTVSSTQCIKTTENILPYKKQKPVPEKYPHHFSSQPGFLSSRLKHILFPHKNLSFRTLQFINPKNLRISSGQAPGAIHVSNEIKDNDILPNAQHQGIKNKKKYGIAANCGELNPLCGIKYFSPRSKQKSHVQKDFEMVYRKPVKPDNKTIAQNNQSLKSEKTTHTKTIISADSVYQTLNNPKAEYQINNIADRVYRIIERKIEIEKDRRGII